MWAEARDPYDMDALPRLALSVVPIAVTSSLTAAAGKVGGLTKGGYTGISIALLVVASVVAMIG